MRRGKLDDPREELPHDASGTQFAAIVSAACLVESPR